MAGIINICSINDITVLKNPLDRLSTLPGNYKKNMNNKNKIKNSKILNRYDFLYLFVT